MTVFQDRPALAYNLYYSYNEPLSARDSHAFTQATAFVVLASFRKSPSFLFCAVRLCARRHDMHMHLFQPSYPASQLATLISLTLAPALCASTTPPHNIAIAASPKSIRDSDPAIHPSATPFPTNPTPIPTTPPPPPPPPTIHLLSLHLILPPPFLSPTPHPPIALALDRLLESLAYALLDLDLLEAQHLVLRLGAFTLDFYDVAERLSVLAIKAVLVRLARMVERGLLVGWVRGEVVDVRAGVRGVFALGVVGEGGGR